MQVHNGFIKIHRKLMQWGWYQDNVVKGVFLHLLLTASYRDIEWMGRTIKKGQLVTSYKQLAEALGLSTQQVRTAIFKLESTGEIKIESTNKFSVISIVNWDDYQVDDVFFNKQATNEQQTKNGGSEKIMSTNAILATSKSTSKSTNKISPETALESQTTETENETSTSKSTSKSTNKQQTNNKQITNKQQHLKNIKNINNIYNNNARACACAREDDLSLFDDDGIAAGDVNPVLGVAVCDANSLFEKFWEVYPNKMNRNKAFAEFKKLNADEALLKKIIESIALWEQSRQWSDPDFIPHAKTFLQNRQWEIQPPRGKSGGGYEGYPKLC